MKAALTTAFPALFCTGMAIWCLGWSSGLLTNVLGGLNAFLAGALVGQWFTYRHVDSIFNRFERNL